jgi:NDP-sugar pyrophosphorylase family protein
MTSTPSDGSRSPAGLVSQAIILAGGKATRMRPYTDDAPKAMVPVAGTPIIGYQLAWLAEHGVKRVVLSVGYKADMIRDYVSDGSRFGIDASYAVEDEPLGRGGGLKFAARMLPEKDARFLALNGDVITRFALPELAKHHYHLGGAVTIALSPYRSNWGVVHLDGDRICDFIQSPRLPYWINAGVYVISPEVVAQLPDKGDHEDSTFPQLAKAGQLVGFKIDGYWRGIDTVKDVKEATVELVEQGYVLSEQLRRVGTVDDDSSS